MSAFLLLTVTGALLLTVSNAGCIVVFIHTTAFIYQINVAAFGLTMRFAALYFQ
jgi:hypothetical protein